MNSSALGPPGQDLDSGHVVSGEAKSLPKDAQVITAILKEMGITEWEPRVVTQLLEFVYRYVTSVVEDAKLVSGHARKKTIDVEDIILAVEMYNEQHYSTPPPRDVLLDAARIRNSNPLPIPKTTSGLRLPPDRFCLTGCNYRLKYKKNQGPPRTAVSGINRSSIPAMHLQQGGRQVITINPNIAPRIQIQPGSVAGNQPAFSMTLDPMSLKRKASDD